METPEQSQNTTEGTGGETERIRDDEPATVMPEQEAEDQPREPSPPPSGSGPSGDE